MRRQGRIAVVGGGPAGATLARLMARAGADVTMFESRPASEKPCGGGVPAAALGEFPELADPALPRRVVREVILYSPSNLRARVQVAGGIHIFKRAELDAGLRRRAVLAGASLEPVKVKAIRSIPGEGWELLTETGVAGPFRHLVGADGVCGPVRRALAGPVRQESLTLALYAYVAAAPRDEIVLKFFGGFDGYLWVFPRTDHLSVGICAREGTVSPSGLAEELHRFIEQHYPDGRVTSGGLKGYFIPSSVRPAGGGGSSGWALVGDAAGFVDPLTREGIAHAMRSSAALAAYHSRTGDVMTPALPDSLRRAHGCRGGFFRREFLEKTIRLASASSSIRRVLADLLEGRQTYRGLKRRLLLNALPGGLEVGMYALGAILPTRSSRVRAPH